MVNGLPLKNREAYRWTPIWMRSCLKIQAEYTFQKLVLISGRLN